MEETANSDLYVRRHFIMRVRLQTRVPSPRHSEAVGGGGPVGDVTIARSHSLAAGKGLPPNLVNARIRWGSQSVSLSLVVLSLVPVAGSHLSELIMCDKTGMAEGRKKAASLDIIRDDDDDEEICPPLFCSFHTIVISAGIPDRYTFDHL